MIKLEMFSELAEQGLVKSVIVCQSTPSKGKPLETGKLVWLVQIILTNEYDGFLCSSRGTRREWASLDTLNTWLKRQGILIYQVKTLCTEVEN